MENQPCPFCGSKDIELKTTDHHGHGDCITLYIIHCNGCLVDVNPYDPGMGFGSSGTDSENNCWRKWNTRAI